MTIEQLLERVVNLETIAKNIDKVHPVGPTLDNKQQCTVKFKTNSSKEEIYIAQKKQKKHDKHRCLVNFEPFLTEGRIELLSNVNDKIKDNGSVKFVYADMLGTLKMILQNPLK